MRKRLTTEEFIKNAQKIHGDKYNYLETEYVGARTKIKIICRKHGSFFQVPYSHLTGCGCVKCFHEILTSKLTKTQDEFIKQCKEIYKNKYDYGRIKYINSATKIEIICSIHGSFWIIPTTFLRGHGCIKCYYKLTGLKLTKKQDEFIKQCEKIHKNKYDYSITKYINNSSKIEIICKNHGPFWIKASHHLSGVDCRLCSIELHTKTQDEFIKQCKNVHKNKYDYSRIKYINSATKIEIICLSHGPFWMLAGNHLSSGQGCPKCTHFISKPEIQWLNGLNIPNDLLHRNVTLKINGKRFIVDGLVPETKTVYEFNGDYWHGNPIKYLPDKINKANKQTFGFLYQKTLNKKAALEAAGYTVISIWESEFKGSLKR